MTISPTLTQNSTISSTKFQQRNLKEKNLNLSPLPHHPKHQSNRFPVKVIFHLRNNLQKKKNLQSKKRKQKQLRKKEEKKKRLDPKLSLFILKVC